jgi:nitrogen fixation protein NifU and related proteins
VRGKTQTGNAGLENLRQGFHTVRHGGDDQIRTHGKDLISFGRPGILDDDGSGVAQFGTDIEAISGASGEQVEPAKIAQSYGNTWLKGHDSLWWRNFWHDGIIGESFSKGSSVSYSEKVLEHFENPRNVGELADADGDARLEHPVCGDIMRITIKVADGRIEQIRFKSRGCVASIAAGSCLTEMVAGKPLSDARSLRREQLVEALGGLNNASIHASHLAIDVLAQALKQLP